MFTVRRTACLAACFASSLAWGQESTLTLKFSHWVPPTHILATGSIANWVKSVETASGGSIKVTVFPAGQLGKPGDHYDMARDGIADLAWHNPGLSAGRFPIFAVSQLPMLINDSRGGSQALTEWYRAYEGREMADVKLCFGHMMYSSTLHTKAKVVSPEDLKGMKIRPSSSSEATLIRLAGGAAVPGANPQAREMIDRGVIDGTTGVPASQIAFGVDKSVKFHLDIPLSQPAWVVVMNKAKYTQMSPRQKRAIDDNCTPEAARRFTEPMYDVEHAGLPTLRSRNEPGREVTVPPPDAMAKWRALAASVKAEWMKEVSGRGVDANAVFEGFMKAVARQDAQVK
ncbi:MAG: TRAP transporter substrate-binding protein [Burkholderiales bacterium]|nr:TRAP transporter substrate-binding protein [Burkholderiales bacterium]